MLKERTRKRETVDLAYLRGSPVTSKGERWREIDLSLRAVVSKREMKCALLLLVINWLAHY